MIIIKVGGENSFLNRVYIERFLPLRKASHVIRDMISEALKHENFGFDVLKGIQNDLSSYINSMCTGPVSMGDREQVGSREIEQIKLKFKSIDAEMIKGIVDSNRPTTTGTGS